MRDVDVVVLGSGASGLSAALTAAALGGEVLILESNDRWGGTSAISGGGIWAPGNPFMEDMDETDSDEEAMAYLNHYQNPGADQQLMRGYLERNREALRFIDAHSATGFQVMLRPDYRPAAPGSKLSRAVETALFDPAPLGELAGQVYEREAHVPIRTSETWGGIGYEAGEPFKAQPDDLDARMQAGVWARGRALVGTLLAGALASGAELALGQRATRPLLEDGRVVGVAAEDGTPLARARRGVVLATGGFEWSEDLCARFLRAPINGAMSPRTNVGDGLRFAASLGASLRSMAEAWWTPLVALPGADGAPFWRLTQVERARPGAIVVDQHGDRFFNEAVNYQDAGRAMQRFNASSFDYDQSVAYLVFDGRYRAKFGIFNSAHNRSTESVGDVDPEWLVKEDSIPALAGRLGMEPGRLEATVRRFNAFAAQGHDDDFGRGDNTFDIFHGDPERAGALKTLGPVDEPPFYAVRMANGVLGTNGGPAIDSWARVIDVWGQPIEGLYAAGNAAGSGFGLLYAGPGSTLGPCVTWGYAAGRHAMSRGRQDR